LGGDSRNSSSLKKGRFTNPLLTLSHYFILIQNNTPLSSEGKKYTNATSFICGIIFCARNYVPSSKALIFSSLISTTVRNLIHLQYVILAVLEKATSQVIRDVFSLTKICPHSNDKKKKEKEKA